MLSVLLLSLSAVVGCSDDEPPEIPKGVLQLVSVSVGNQVLSLTEDNLDTETEQPIVIRFSAALDTETLAEKISLQDSEERAVGFEISTLDESKTISLKPTLELLTNTLYTLRLNDLQGEEGQTFDELTLQFKTKAGTLTITSITINGVDLKSTGTIQNIDTDFEIVATFSHPVEEETITEQSARLLGVGVPIVNRTLSNDKLTLTIDAESDLRALTRHRLVFEETITTLDERIFTGFDELFYTQLDSTFKFPALTDEELLTKVQEQTFKYFWDFGHPVSGLSRERNTSGNTVTSGGSGFGLMAIIVGIERGFITREQGIDRLETIVNFLANDADRFHGVWSHWLNGNTGVVVPFSANDDGGDLVETSFLIQGLITVRQYLEDANPQELAIKNTINTIWEEVEWDWYVQEGTSYLTWHWSPNFEFEKNLRIRGWNESLITYVLAASSPTHSIDKSVYTEGWASNGGMQNGEQFYDITLPLGNTRGGPLFFSHYSFLGLDPRNLQDQYANYWEQNVAHSQINRAYCIANPGGYVGYSTDCWGLTASDSHGGYTAHSPTNDRSVITPTAAISSIPYTPEESMDAIRHFYYLLGDKLWGEYGFYDAFSPTESWYATSYLAIDQGPIVSMIENHRTGLLWDLFMSAPEIQNGLDKLDFTY